MQPAYRTVYDVAVELLPHPGYLIATIMLVFVGVLRLVYQTRRNKARGTGWMIIALGSAFGIVTCLAPVWDVHQLKAAERNGAAFVVEGPITGHMLRTDTLDGRHPQPLTYEAFTVSNVLFAFYRERDGAGFHNGGAHPEALREGQLARVTYLPRNDTVSFPNRILRLELAYPEKGTPR